MIVLNSCIFCFKPVFHYKLGPQARNDVRKFFVLFQRHISSNSSPSKLKWLLNQVEKDVNIWPCVECHGILKTFNKLYNQLKNLEIQTNWVLDKLGGIMKETCEVPDGVHQFPDLQNGFGDVKNAIGEMSQVKLIKQFRHELQRKCDYQLRQQFPRVALTKLEVMRPAIKIEVDTDSLIMGPYEDMNMSTLEIQTEDFLNHPEIRKWHTRFAVQNILKVMTSLKIVFELALISNGNGNSKKIHEIKPSVTSVIREEQKEKIRREFQTEKVSPVSHRRQRNTFKCHKCQQKFGNFSLLKYHWGRCNPREERNLLKKPIPQNHIKKSPAPKNPSVKSRCNRVSNPINNNRHNRLINSCTYCDRKFTRKCTMEAHIRNIHSKRQRNNQKQANSFTNQKRKNVKNSSEGEFKCGLCPYFSAYRAGLWYHTRLHEKSSRTCSLCNYPITTDLQLRIHMRDAHKTAPLPKVVSNKSSIKATATSVLSNPVISLNSTKMGKKVLQTKQVEPKMFKCDKCPYTNMYKWNFNLHSMLHKTSIQTCKLCNYPINTDYQFKFHMTTQHPSKQIDTNGNRAWSSPFVGTKVVKGLGENGKPVNEIRKNLKIV